MTMSELKKAQRMILQNVEKMFNLKNGYPFRG